MPKYNSIINEITEQLALHEKDHPTKFLQTIIGIADTDLGLGIIVEAIRNEDKSLAKTLRDMLADGSYESMHSSALNELLEWLSNSPVIIRDFSTNNLVWDGQNRCFVIIDGIGGKSTFSIRRLCAPYNHYSNRKRIKRMKQRVADALAKK